METIRIGTFNVFNLVWPEIKYYGNKKYKQDDFERKTSWIAGQLDKLGSDIVGFQEVFHAKALQGALAKTDKLKDAQTIVADPSEMALADPPVQEEDLGPKVALASAFPVTAHEIISAFPEDAVIDVEGNTIPLTTFSRPVLRATVQVNESLDLTVFVVHLKSKRPMIPSDVDQDDPLEKAKGQARSLILRSCEATALRAILLERLKKKTEPVVLLGDVNDDDLAVTTQIATGEPPWRRLPFASKKKIWDVLLYNVRHIQARKSQRDFYFTHIYNGHFEALDQIAVSEEFVAENSKGVGRVGYVKVLNDHLIDETLTWDEVEKWQSDHGQVSVFLELKSNPE